ncbi:MAG: HNH endonuclease [Tepidisphaeraceae bacterium]
MIAKLRGKVFRRARHRCEYCRVPFEFDFAGEELDHVIAQQHGGPTTFSNLAAACGYCNRFKGTNLSGIDPRTGKVVRLFNPRKDKWEGHFRWSGPLLVGLTPEGRTTVRLLAINLPDRLAARASLMNEGLFE